MHTFAHRSLAFFRKETVLCVAVLLAVVSCFFVPPSSKYISYVDWNTLSLLFSLMAVMKGFQKFGLFDYLGSSLLKKVFSTRATLLVLIFLPFVFSMLITNDVSLITFVPFSIIVLRMAGQLRLLVPTVVLQTIAANLGSMLTPMGNPQNLYLFTKSGYGFDEFCLIMLPYALISAVLLAALCIFRRSVPVTGINVPAALGSNRALLCCAFGLILCLLGIFKMVPPLAAAVITAAFLLLRDRSLLAEIDYSLLGTFLAFFIFIGNLGNIEEFRNFLVSILSGHEELVSVLTSQVISNVPAALLLSGFTSNWQALIVGCNLGGLGTLIASMASLISYKLVVKEYPEKKKGYFIYFTLANIAFLIILLGVSYLL